MESQGLTKTYQDSQVDTSALLDRRDGLTKYSASTFPAVLAAVITPDSQVSACDVL